METIRIILDLLIILLALYWLFIKSYTAEKGKNLATKEDIKEITDKIEAVKLEYLKRIEEYKKELNIKYELDKTLINSKVEAYQITAKIRETIQRRKNNLGDEREQMQIIFEKIPELLIHVSSQVQLENDYEDESQALAVGYNEIVAYIEKLRIAGAINYSINLDNIDEYLKKIQIKLLGQ